MYEIMDYIKNFFLLGFFVVIVLLLLLRGCDSEPKTVIKTVHTVDTTYIPGKTDTVFITKSHKDIPGILVDSLVKPDLMDLSDTSVFFSTYMYPIKDSLLEGTITATSQYRPKIDFEYTLKSLHTTDTIQIKDSTYVKEQVLTNKLYLGGGLSVQPFMSQMYFGATFAEKRGNLFEAGVAYDFKSNSPIISVGYKKIISFRKK